MYRWKRIRQSSSKTSICRGKVGVQKERWGRIQRQPGKILLSLYNAELVRSTFCILLSFMICRCCLWRKLSKWSVKELIIDIAAPFPETTQRLKNLLIISCRPQHAKCNRISWSTPNASKKQHRWEGEKGQNFQQALCSARLKEICRKHSIRCSSLGNAPVSCFESDWAFFSFYSILRQKLFIIHSL